MKTIAIVHSPEMPPRTYLAKQILCQQIQQQSLKLTDNIAEAELIIVIGENISDERQLTGKKVFFTDEAQTISKSEKILSIAKKEAIIVDKVNFSKPAAAKNQRVLAVTACPTGVAHTFMAAEALEIEAKKRGWQIKVETRGSVGTGNEISSAEINEADFIIAATDIEVDLTKFAGKRIYHTSTSAALKKTAQEMDNALTKAEYYQPHKVKNSSDKLTEKTATQGVYRHLLTGVSYMLPMVVAGGLCIALSFMFGLDAAEQPGTLAAALMQIGKHAALALMVPILSGYIAYSIADRTGLTPGLVGGMLAVSTNAGFLGGIIAGFLAGYVAKLLNQHFPLPKSMASLKPILIVPLFATLITGLVMIYIIGNPVSWVMTALTEWLTNIGTTNAVILGIILGAMMCTDMGGPVNKASYAFGVALLSAQTYGPMAAIMAAGMVPPLAMGLATLFARHKFSSNEREGGKAAFILGLCFISEGAIPFAARDPMRVLPICMLGGAITGALSMYFHVTLMAPHGGLFVMLIPGAVQPIIAYLLAIISGTLISAILYAYLKRSEVDASLNKKILN